MNFRTFLRENKMDEPQNNVSEINIIDEKPKQKSASKQKKNSAGFIILIALIVITLGFASYAVITRQDDSSAPVNTEQNNTNNKPIEIFKSFNFSSENEKGPVLPKGEYIAKIFITGVIQEENKTYSQKWLLNTISALEKDDNNKGIILFIDSPGGSVYESDEAYLALLQYQKSNKPVWAYMGSLAASGGYYISCGAQYICANRNTLTGSIGVIAGESVDLTELMANLGIKSKTFTAGRNKNMLNYNSSLTEEHEQIMQSIADECYEQFTDIVAESRGLSKEEVYKLADGRIYTASQAKEASLINSIGTLDELIETMQRKEFDFAEYETADFSYQKEDSIYRMIMGSAKEFKKASLGIPDAVMEVLEPQIEFPAYYYK